MNNSYLIDFDKLGDDDVGYISVGQTDRIPFEIKRVFWTYGTPETITRGRHSHYKTEQVLVAVCGRIIVTTESADGEVRVFTLEAPDRGVYIPPDVWHIIQYSHGAVQVVMTSTLYNEHDYIRDYEKFKQVWKAS